MNGSGNPLKPGYSLVVREDTIGSYLEAIAEAGFAGIEPTFISGAIPDPEDHRRGARHLRKRCDEIGLEIPSMRGGAVPWTTIPSNDPAERTRALDHAERACEALAILGGSVLLVVPGRRSPEVDYATHRSRAVEFARSAAEIAGRYDMRIGFENVEARFPVSEDDWCRLIDEIDSPRVGIYFDVGNVLWLGFGYPEQWIRTLGDRIIQVHFKDASYRLHGATLQAEIRYILEGEVDWPGVLGALADIDYRGWVSVEPEPYAHLPERLPARLAGDLESLFALYRPTED